MMRECTNGHDIIRPGPTRFASQFIALESLHQFRHELGTLIHSSEYLAHVATLREESRDVAHEISCLVSDHRFWEKIHYYLKLIEPLVQVLRMVDGEDKNDMGYLYEAMDKAKERLREKHPQAYKKWWKIIDARWESTLHHDLHAAGYFFNPRHQYSDSPHNDGEVLQGTINVIGRLSRSMDERIDAMIEMDRFKLKLDIYRDYDVKEAVTRMGPGSHWEQRFAEREALSSQIDVDELFDEEHPLNAWVETRQERDVPEFDPRDCSWAEGELDGVEAGDPELRNIREAEEKDKGMDKGDMKDNNIMQPMSGHLGSQTIVQGLLIYLHFSLPFYRTQILVAHLMEYKEDGDLGLHKNKSLVALVKQQVHTNRLVYGVQLHHNLEKAQVNNLHQEGFKWVCMI
ncbi:hypothetical protein Taro_011240 [Colocasia esculenta]|uniref:Uncharacterized protein n=1 Tax=Colocasia esculenta TaxID=4460 RepID=A0A843UA17_COLES|nr:hypothetical protein [Colocasia esculenta]